METLYLNLKGKSIEDKIEILETVEWGFNQIGEEAEISLNYGSLGMVTAISVNIDQEISHLNGMGMMTLPMT